jgi:hypothetical protein
VRLLAGLGATPQIFAEADSLLIRLALSPAVTKNCPRELGAHSEHCHELRCSVGNERGDLGAERLDLIVQVLPAPSQVTKGELGRRDVQALETLRRARCGSRSQGGAAGTGSRACAS